MRQNGLQLKDIFLYLMICLFLSGCVEQAIPKLEPAVHALEDARISGAEDYAVEIFTEAETAYFQAKDELDQQQDRLVLFRDYESAAAMLAKAITSAAQAKIEAIANKEEVKANAEVALLAARQTLQNLRLFVEEFSVPVTDQGEFVQLALAIQAAEALLAETESGMTQEKFIGVMTTAHSIESFAGRIQDMMLSAKQLAAKRQV